MPPCYIFRRCGVSSLSSPRWRAGGLGVVLVEAACNSFDSAPATDAGSGSTDAPNEIDGSILPDAAFDCIELNEHLDETFDQSVGELTETTPSDAGTLTVADGVLVASVPNAPGARAYARRSLGPLSTPFERLRLSFKLVSIKGTSNASLVVPGCAVTLSHTVDNRSADIRLELKNGNLTLDDSARVDGGETIDSGNGTPSKFLSASVSRSFDVEIVVEIAPKTKVVRSHMRLAEANTELAESDKETPLATDPNTVAVRCGISDWSPMGGGATSPVRPGR